MDDTGHRDPGRGGAFCCRARLTRHEVVGQAAAERGVVDQRQEGENGLVAPRRQSRDGPVRNHPDRMPRREALQRAQGFLEQVGLGAFSHRYPHMLSGGQRKRVGLAQVLIRDPKILLMDEPFGPLDAQTRQIMGNLLLDLWSADRKAVLFVTHDLEEAISLADRVVIMSAGPSARIIGDWRVPLSRPRDITEVKLDKAFHDLHREIWDALKDEVMKGYVQSTQAEDG